MPLSCLNFYGRKYIAQLLLIQYHTLTLTNENTYKKNENKNALSEREREREDKKRKVPSEGINTVCFKWYIVSSQWKTYQLRPAEK